MIPSENVYNIYRNSWHNISVFDASVAGDDYDDDVDDDDDDERVHVEKRERVVVMAVICFCKTVPAKNISSFVKTKNLT